MGPENAAVQEVVDHTTPTDGTSKTGTIELDQQQVLAIQLVMMKKQKAVLAEKLATMQLKEAQRELMVNVRDEAVVLAKIAQAHGLGRFKSVKVVGPNRLAYELE